MVFIPHRRRCKTPGARRRAIVVSATAGIVGAVLSSLLQHGWGPGEGVDATWYYVSLGACGLLVAGVVAYALYQWRKQEEKR